MLMMGCRYFSQLLLFLLCPHAHVLFTLTHYLIHLYFPSLASHVPAWSLLGSAPSRAYLLQF